jgi:hypothetical protein
MKYYALVIDSGVEVEIRGPFATPAARDHEARKVVRLGDFNRDYDSIFRMDVEEDVPDAYSFAHDELYVEV